MSDMLASTDSKLKSDAEKVARVVALMQEPTMRGKKACDFPKPVGEDVMQEHWPLPKGLHYNFTDSTSNAIGIYADDESSGQQLMEVAHQVWGTHVNSSLTPEDKEIFLRYQAGLLESEKEDAESKSESESESESEPDFGALLQKRDLKEMIDVYEYADQLWREDARRPKICARQPREILSMLKSLYAQIHKEEPFEVIRTLHYKKIKKLQQEIVRLQDQVEDLQHAYVCTRDRLKLAEVFVDQDDKEWDDNNKVYIDKPKEDSDWYIEDGEFEPRWASDPESVKPTKEKEEIKKLQQEIVDLSCELGKTRHKNTYLEQCIDSLKRENSHILKQADPQKSFPSDDEKRYQDGLEVGDEEQVGAWRIYLGSDAYKVDLPDQELFFDTLKDAMKQIDEINEDTCGNLKLSYDTIDFEWYGPYEPSDGEGPEPEPENN